MSVVKVIEVLSSSKKSWEDATQKVWKILNQLGLKIKV